MSQVLVAATHARSARLLVLLAGLGAPLAVFAQNSTAPASTPAAPIGRWVADHPSNGGIGSWWDFRPDGTLTCYIGAMVTSPISRSGDTLTMSAGIVAAQPTKVKFRIEGDRLYLTSGGKEIVYDRLGNAPSAIDPLAGKWRPVPPKTPASYPDLGAMEKASANAVYVFTADTESVRIPFTSREGTWSSINHTFQFQTDKVAYPFQVSGAKLLLGQPPDGKRLDSYAKDPIF